ERARRGTSRAPDLETSGAVGRLAEIIGVGTVHDEVPSLASHHRVPVEKNAHTAGHSRAAPLDLGDPGFVVNADDVVPGPQRQARLGDTDLVLLELIRSEAQLGAVG